MATLAQKVLPAEQSTTFDPTRPRPRSRDLGDVAAGPHRTASDVDRDDGVRGRPTPLLRSVGGALAGCTEVPEEQVDSNASPA